MHDHLHLAHAARAWKTVREHPLLWAIAPAALWAGTGAFLDTIGFFLSLNPFAPLPFLGPLILPLLIALAPVILLGIWTQGTILHIAGSHAREQATHLGHGILASARALPTLIAIHLIAGTASLFVVTVAWGMRHGTLLGELPVHMHRPIAAVFLLLSLFFVLNWQWLALAYASHAPKHIRLAQASRAAWHGITHNTLVLAEHNILLFLLMLASYLLIVIITSFFPLLFASPIFLLTTATGIALPIASLLPVLEIAFVLACLSLLTAWATASWAHLAERMLGEKLSSSFWKTIQLYTGRE